VKRPASYARSAGAASSAWPASSRAWSSVFSAPRCSDEPPVKS
jgi:hypothetical protein